MVFVDARRRGLLPSSSQNVCDPELRWIREADVNLAREGTFVWVCIFEGAARSFRRPPLLRHHTLSRYS